MNNTIFINPKKTAKVLLTVISILLLGHLMYLFTVLVKGYKFHYMLEIFNFNSEGNLPTLYSVMAIIFTAILLLFVAFIKRKRDKNQVKYWVVLGILFLLMAYDEASQMHERLNAYTRELLPESSLDFLYFAWVIPYAILVLVIGLFFIRFLLSLPNRTKILFIAAGVIFVTGAIGFEMITSYYRGGTDYRIYLVITIEELMEMLGIVLFIYAILDYIKDNIGETISVFIIKNSPEKIITSYPSATPVKINNRPDIVEK